MIDRSTVGAQASPFTQEQIDELKKPLDPRFIGKRKGGSGRTLSYLEGHDAIDQANRIFGYGNWAYRPALVEQVVLIDPLSGEAVGVEYKAIVELTVRGAIAPIGDVGSQPVAAWSVDEQIMQRREANAKYNHTAVDTGPFTDAERKNARAVITEAHEQAKKGAVTDALKRCLRAYGNQFGNGLYGDGPVDLDAPTGNAASRQNGKAAGASAGAQNGKSQGQKPAASARTSDDHRQESKVEVDPQNSITEQQWTSICNLCHRLGKPEPDAPATYAEATELIAQLSQEYRESRKAS